MIVTLPRLFALAALAVLPGLASAQSLPEDAYLRAFGGATAAIDGGSVSGASGGVALGYRFPNTSAWRVEAEIARRMPDGSGGSQKSTSLMMNALRDIAPLGPAMLYAGAGIGAIKIEESAGGVSDSDTQAVGQIILGAEFPLSASTDLSVETRYINAGDLPVSDGDAEWVDVSAGLVFSF